MYLVGKVDACASFFHFHQVHVFGQDIYHTGIVELAEFESGSVEYGVNTSVELI